MYSERENNNVSQKDGPDKDGAQASKEYCFHALARSIRGSCY